MTISDPERAWHFKELRRSLRGLATAGTDQQVLFPDFVMTADELALDFDHWGCVIRSNYHQELSASQLESLGEIDRKLATMSRDGADFDVELWTDAAMRGSEHWADVRRL